MAVCFFRLCEAAGLGKLLIGRKGQVTRLRVEKNGLSAFIRDAEAAGEVVPEALDIATDKSEDSEQATTELTPPASSVTDRPKPIFIGHGKKKGPLEKVERFLNDFKIPHRIAVQEPNLGRPISAKVKEVMAECGSAILIFTCDERLRNDKGDELWRPSENVVHEFGAASYAYDGRIVVMKEKGLDLPSNFSDIGYIEFEENQMEAKNTDLLRELIGFGLVRVAPA
jgi:predicted nucleotide-binding protein